MKTFECIKNQIKHFMSEKRNRVIVLLAAITSVVIVGSFCYFQSGAVDLTDCIVVEEVSGLNNQGIITYSIDGSKLRDAMFGEETFDEFNNYEKMSNKQFNKAMDGFASKIEEIGNLLDSIELTATPDTHLSNGDKVTIKAVLNNKNDYKFSKRIKNGKLTYTVKGLKDGKEFDVFSKDVMTVEFTGFSGKGEAELKIKDTELTPYIHYSLSKEQELSNGDVVTVTVQVNDTKFEDLGYFVPEKNEKKYKVSGLPEFVKSASDIPASSLGGFKKEALRKFQTKVDDMVSSSFRQIEESKIEGVYFAKMKDPEASHKDLWYGININNCVLVITKTTFESDTFGPEISEFRQTYLFPDCSILKGGEFEYDTKHITELTFEGKTEDDQVEWLEQRFSDMDLTSLE